MTITDLVLILFIAALLAFAIYDQFIMPRRNGPLCWQFLCSGVVASIALSSSD
ncbi:inner membrane protein [Escherichia coli]|nr:inner membrane protein [Escherichia coli]